MQPCGGFKNVHLLVHTLGPRYTRLWSRPQYDYICFMLNKYLWNFSVTVQNGIPTFLAVVLMYRE
jgi:hypothetical protein